jgi:hypothetical protein
MADGLQVTEGTGKTVATDEIAGKDYQRIKLIYGADGTNEGDVTNANPFPVGAAQQTDKVMNGKTVLTPKFAIIAASGVGDNTLVTAVIGKKIRVLSYSFVCAGAVTVRFEDGAGGSALSGQMEFAANSGISPSFCPLGHFETSVNTLLNLELSAGISVAGHLVYVEV